MRWPVQEPRREGDGVLRLLIEIPTNSNEEHQQRIAADVARRIRVQVSEKAKVHRDVSVGPNPEWAHVEPAEGI